ncbi:MAG: hypothetical protein AAFP90_14335, partial [Planctomycetota bacterium]
LLCGGGVFWLSQHAGTLATNALAMAGNQAASAWADPFVDQDPVQDAIGEIVETRFADGVESDESMDIRLEGSKANGTLHLEIDPETYEAVSATFITDDGTEIELDMQPYQEMRQQQEQGFDFDDPLNELNSDPELYSEMMESDVVPDPPQTQVDESGAPRDGRIDGGIEGDEEKGDANGI